MGLDITAREQLREETPPSFVSADGVLEWAHENGYSMLYINRDFPGRADEYRSGVVYRTDGETFEFRAGSYGGYNAWRRQLAALVGAEPEQIWRHPKPGPFFELIAFSDAEGTIGAAVSKKLAADFAEWESRAEKRYADDGWFIQQYGRWRRAFEIAAKGGAVSFH